MKTLSNIAKIRGHEFQSEEIKLFNLLKIIV